MIPNAYIFRLSDGKHVVVEAPVSKFHVAHAVVLQHLKDTNLDLTIDESDPWKPDEIGYQMVLRGHPDFHCVLRIQQ